MNITPIVKTILLLNIAVFILDELLDGQLGLYGGLYFYESPFFHVWQLVSYMFLHGGFMHLFFNLFALWMFGCIMERTWGVKRFLIYFFVCGIGAGLTQEVGQALGYIPSYARTIGASGAVYGILLSFGMVYPNEKLFIIPIPFPVKAKYLVFFYALLELFESLGMRDGVAHAAHLGGMLFGAILILAWKSMASRHRFSQNDNYWQQSTTSYSYDSYDKGGKGFFSKITDMFKGEKKPKMTVTYGGRYQDQKFNEEKKKNTEEIDRILDKVRTGGYSSLTEAEKATLFDASKK